MSYFKLEGFIKKITKLTGIAARYLVEHVKYKQEKILDSGPYALTICLISLIDNHICKEQTIPQQ